MDKNRDDLAWFIPEYRGAENKDARSRVKAFIDWLLETGRSIENPDLEEYHKNLTEKRKLAPSTVRYHLSAVRMRYEELLANNTIKERLEASLAPNMSDDELAAEVDHIIQSIRNAIDPDLVKVKVESQESYLQRLTTAHLLQMVESISVKKELLQKRDKTVFALLCGLGLRQSEAVNLDVRDTYYVTENRAGVVVRPGVGCTERFVPYDRLKWVNQWIEDWTSAAHITDGPVLRGFLPPRMVVRDPQRSPGSPLIVVRDTPLSSRTVEKILATYRVYDADTAMTIKINAMDLRRAHARLLFEGGVSLPEIQARLGLKDANAVLAYIGGDEASLGIPEDEDPFDFFQKHFGPEPNTED